MPTTLRLKQNLLAETNKIFNCSKRARIDEMQSLPTQAYEAENQQLRQRVQIRKAFSESEINRLTT